MKNKPHDAALAGGLVLSVILFGANNTGIKYMLGTWPPMTVGASRLLLAGLVLLGLLRWTRIFGARHELTSDLKKRLWLSTGLNMALYIVVFYYSLKLTSVSHVALYLGTSPVWALLWEGRPEKHWKSIQRYAAAALAFFGVLTLLGPSLHQGTSRLPGEILGLCSSVLWAWFGHQTRALTGELSGAEISAHTFWRAGLVLAPFAVVELFSHPFPLRAGLIAVQAYCVVGGGVAAFGLWNSALRHWKASQVLLFNNLVPISTMTWAHFCLGEPFSRTFWTAMALIGTGVFLGQADLQKVFGIFWLPWD